MNLLFYLLVAACTMVSYAQNCSIKKGFAYQRATIPANIPRKTLDEAGKEIEAPVKVMSTLFIYVETKKDCHFEANRIWIAGKAYQAMQEEIINTPVIIQYSYPGTPPDTLVKKTTNKVLRLLPKEELQIKPDKNIIKAQTGAKIIIEYTRKSKTVYYPIQDIKRIAPIVLQ